MAASRTGVVGVPSDVDVTCVLSFTSAFPTQHRWVMIKTNFQPKIGLKQPNALTQRSQPSIWVEKTTQRFLECVLMPYFLEMCLLKEALFSFGCSRQFSIDSAPVSDMLVLSSLIGYMLGCIGNMFVLSYSCIVGNTLVPE